MKTIDNESFNLTPMEQSECLTVNGGCGPWFWCMDRIAFEVEKAGEAFAAGVAAGYEAFNIH